MTEEEIRAFNEREDRKLAELHRRMAEVAARAPAALVLAMLDVLIAAQAGRPEFVRMTRIRIYNAVLDNIASKGIR